MAFRIVVLKHLDSRNQVNYWKGGREGKEVGKEPLQNWQFI